MFSVLIVDDEANIREGIFRNCNWKELEVSSVSMGASGIEALEIIEQSRPDIVITDLKMPGITGIELAEQCATLYSDVLFAILSGHDDFAYVQNAIKLNVFDYLLKPCSIDCLEDLVRRMVGHIKREHQREAYIAETIDMYRRTRNQLNRQLLCNYITSPYTTLHDLIHQTEGYFPQNLSLRLLAFRIDTPNAPVTSLLALQNICRDCFTRTRRRLWLCVTTAESILVLTDYYPFQELLEELNEIRDKHKEYYGMKVSVAVSEESELSRLKQSYKNLLACFSAAFYLGCGNIFTTYDIMEQDGHRLIGDFNTEFLSLAVKSGNVEESRIILDDIFMQMNLKGISIENIRAYSLELFMSVAQMARGKSLDRYLGEMTKIIKSPSIGEIKEILTDTALELADFFHSKAVKRHSELVQKILDLIDKGLADESLSLKRIANDILYVNVDYLGKLFKLETGERFSAYLNQARMQKAQRLFEEDPNIPVGTVASLTGFDGNSQYFSKVFKQHTGYTPKEYCKKFSGGG